MNGAAQIVASNAQLISTTNGGYIGIYKKASFALDFLAEEIDLLGWWSCAEELGKDKSYLTDVATGWSDQQIVADLRDAGLSYEQAWMTSDGSADGTAHLITWSCKFPLDILSYLLY